MPTVVDQLRGWLAVLVLPAFGIVLWSSVLFGSGRAWPRYNRPATAFAAVVFTGFLIYFFCFAAKWR